MAPPPYLRPLFSFCHLLRATASCPSLTLHARESRLDTANVYGYGENETLVGRAIRGLRGKILLVTKVVWAYLPPVRKPRSVNVGLTSFRSDQSW